MFKGGEPGVFLCIAHTFFGFCCRIGLVGRYWSSVASKGPGSFLARTYKIYWSFSTQISQYSQSDEQYSPGCQIPLPSYSW